MIARFRRYVLAPAALALVGGCYGYYTAPDLGGTRLVGRRVQLLLSDSGSVMLTPQLGPSNDAVSGTLLDESADTYTVSVLSVRRRDGDESDWRGERLAIPRPLVSQIAERKFSPGRTALASIFTTVALVAAQQAFSGRGGTGGGGLSTKPGTK